ncbi:Asp23/Gls24 family envelope stress response protein [Microbacterium sp. P26]|uniref:Asp23/Gls24 family envelope stress response protein n=1 Tax=Microbacterium TaxID=33882 RepID=UPI00203FE9C8|nr:Asp23/Gls24 family envelope stress response protein [Microbacterium sp. P26]MCM3503185.1 Asp23/Gls24 family envelope stress response protein [Microbacterium sp. P26]
MAENITAPTDTPAARNVPRAASRVHRPLGGRGPEARTEGTTSIADGVVAKVAGIAAREVTGVYALGGGGARAFGAIRDAVNATDLTQGVKVEVGETQAAVDVTIVVEYGAQIQEVADQVRARIAGSIGRIVGLDVVEVDVAVDDVHVPGDDDHDDDDESRVH